MVNEGVLVLTLLASENIGANLILEDITKYLSTFEQLLGDTETTNKKIKMNICILYSNLVSHQNNQSQNVEIRKFTSVYLMNIY